MKGILQTTKSGLYCEAGDFYIDPWRQVDRAIVTHAHSDHARSGMKRYLCSEESEGVLRIRVGQRANIDTLPFGRQIQIADARVSLHPAGHILGSSQVRIEVNGKVLVVSGDYKTAPDTTCTAFEPVQCHTFITESTFGLPIYRWESDQRIFAAINQWWLNNHQDGITSVLHGYSLGKTQRALSGLDANLGPIYLHPTLEPYTKAYREWGIKLPQTLSLPRDLTCSLPAGAMVLAPPGWPGGAEAPGLQYRSAFMSGWMAVTKSNRGQSGGFVLSDHVDWPSLLEVVKATGAQTVYATHGYAEVVAKYLTETGLQGRVLPTHWDSAEDGD